MRLLASNPSRIMAKASILLFKDVMDHFKQEIGPKDKWKRLSPVTIAGRKKGKRKGTIRKLQDTGALKNSIRPRSTRTTAIVETSIEYAAIHNFGGMAGKNKKVKIPQRRFMFASKKLRNILKIDIGKFFVGSG